MRRIVLGIVAVFGLYGAVTALQDALRRPECRALCAPRRLDRCGVVGDYMVAVCDGWAVSGLIVRCPGEHVEGVMRTFTASCD